ncbi:hypothetical protein MCOR04_009001 [Pyricularia oryzae]|nr:hypothetical protein MCOR04_009001 [Pyricularia oryzae]
MGPREGVLLAILNALLGMEAHGAAELLIGIDAVRDARLDKLIEDLVDPYNQPAPPIPVNLVAARTAASSLQRQWTRRFREMYVSLDRVRHHKFLNSPHMRALAFTGPTTPGAVESSSL